MQVAGVVVGLALGVTAVALAGQHRHSSAHRVRAVGRVDDQQLNAFGVLRRTRTSADVLDPARVPGLLDGAKGIATGQSRLGCSDSAGDEVFLLPGDGILCVVDSIPGDGVSAACADTSEGVQGHAGTENRLNDGSQAVSGVVPDGVEAVTAVLAGGGSKSLPVEGNTYFGILEQAPSAITWTSAAGQAGSAAFPAASTPAPGAG
jgi:hypothetical protein